MPYIKKDARDFIDGHGGPRNAGELNYVFSMVALEYLATKGENYQNYNDIIGALEGAKMEIYRRFVVPYEDKKIVENGDITFAA